jgi:hypothetical protein
MRLPSAMKAPDLIVASLLPRFIAEAADNEISGDFRYMKPMTRHPEVRV